MKIVVGFSTSDMWFSKIIRFCTRSKVSHTYIKIYDEFLEESLILHVERTMCILREKEFKRDNIIIEEFEIDDKRLDDSIKKNLKHLGKKFAWWDWFSWFPLVKKWLKTKIRNPSYSFQKMICVDFVLRVLNDSGMTHLPYNVLTPETLRQWFNYFYKRFGWQKIITEGRWLDEW